MLLIDSSAIVKFFSKEDGWEKVEGYIAESLTVQLALVELPSALHKKVIKKEMEEDIALELLKGYIGSAITLDQKQYMGSAFRIAVGKNISVYDSVFLAAALHEGLDLLSCDEKQLNVARSLGIRTVNC